MAANGHAPAPPLAYIDALRGVAVTMVIASHAFPMVHDLPWAVKRFTNLGFFGVQLFFVLSAFTLARSWRRRARHARPGLRDFALRRVFRIVPPYFLAALVYFWWLPAAPVTPGRLATFLTFTNGWSPAQMPTVADAWVGVPGGWSIEAEFAFYACFPLIITWLRGPASALAACLASLPLAWLANQAACGLYTPLYGHMATDQFLYYWLPNQLPAFLCGVLLHEAGDALQPGGIWHAAGGVLARRPVLLLAAGALGLPCLAIIPVPRVPQPGWAFLSAPFLAASAFAAISLSLAARPMKLPMTLIVNPVTIRLGQASFSAYLIHFAVLSAIAAMLPAWLLALPGMRAIAAACLLFIVGLGVTFVLAQITYRMVEKPAIALGTQIIRSCLPAPPPKQPSLAQGPFTT